jgi:hypothetical protein
VGRYLDKARKVSEEQTTPPAVRDIVADVGCEESEISEESSEYRRLIAAKWEPKVRMSKIIWESPQSGFWYGQEMALELLRLEEGPPVRGGG